MVLHRKARRLLYAVAPFALLIAVVALWVPTSWQAGPQKQGEWVGKGAAVTHVYLGALRPLRLTWESSANGFWLGCTAVRTFPLFLSVTLTVAAVLVAWQTIRARRMLTSGSS
jgi:hypothetical protein